MQVLSFRKNKKTLRPLCVFLVVLVLLSPMGRFNSVFAHAVDQAGSSSATLSTPPAGDDDGLDLPFSVETLKLDSGCELVTIFYRLNGTFDKPDGSGERSPVPLVSVLRDTLGDNIKENDKLSYVWMLTYTSPSTMQKLMSAVPFYYRRGPSKKAAGATVPPPIANMSGSSSQLFETILWQIVRRGYAGGKPKMIWGSWRANHAQYKRSAIAEALTILSLYEQVTGEKGLTDTELADVKTRLGLTDKTFGGMVLRENYLRANDKMYLEGKANVGQTRELLRRFTEAQGLYFEPLEMPDGSAKHAIAWVFAEDLQTNKGRQWEGRFLNIKSPWGDERLLNWNGYSEVRWFDADSREVPANTLGAVSKTLIPLAIYGLDHPKIPIILVDFRDVGNPKKREMTTRVFDDITGNVLSIAQGGGMGVTLGKFLYGFVTGRRGMDLNQPYRVRAYSQLKMILAMDESLKEQFRREVDQRLEKLSINPLENDLADELNLARGQYKNLVEYARSPEGLTKKLEKDRIREMTLAAHGGKMPKKYSILQAVTFGLYKHRLKPTPELMAKADLRRQLDFHERRIRETAYFSVRPEVDANVRELIESLNFVAEKGNEAGGRTATAISKIFASTLQDDIRNACLAGLFRMKSAAAHDALLAIFNDKKFDPRWREAASEYLKRARADVQNSTKRASAVPVSDLH
jgi:hypothetical protein